jgi:hypothetical protein
MRLVCNTLLDRRMLFVFRWELKKHKGGICIVFQYKSCSSTLQQRLVKLRVQVADMYHKGMMILLQFLCAQSLK